MTGTSSRGFRAAALFVVLRRYQQWPMIYNLDNRVVNNYLVSLDEDGYVLIDTGYVDGFKGFTKKLVQLTGKTIFSFEKLILLHIEIKSLCSFPDQIQMLPLSGHT